jgi:hypothetical protein
MPLTEKQKKLPPALQKAILAKQEKDAKKPKVVLNNERPKSNPKKNKMYK